MTPHLRVTQDGEELPIRFANKFAAEVYVFDQKIWYPESQFEIYGLEDLGEITLIVPPYDPEAI